MPLSVLPTEPRYWRATCAVWRPSLRSPVSSMTSTPWVVGAGCRVGQQQLQAVLVDLLVVPGRLRQEPLQALHGPMLGTDQRLGAGQGGQGLVAVAGQQQALQVGAQAAALRERTKQRVELGGVVLQGAGGGRAGQPFGHRDHLTSDGAP